MAKVAKRVLSVTIDQPQGVEPIEITAESLSVKEALAFDQLPTVEMIEAFSRKLRSWNVEDDDGPVPATLDGLHSLDMGFVLDMIRGWSDAITAVSDPLERRSTSTLPWEVPSFPTEVLSESR